MSDQIHLVDLPVELLVGIFDFLGWCERTSLRRVSPLFNSINSHCRCTLAEYVLEREDRLMLLKMMHISHKLNTQDLIHAIRRCGVSFFRWLVDEKLIRVNNKVIANSSLDQFREIVERTLRQPNYTKYSAHWYLHRTMYIIFRGPNFGACEKIKLCFNLLPSDSLPFTGHFRLWYRCAIMSPNPELRQIFGEICSRWNMATPLLDDFDVPHIIHNIIMGRGKRLDKIRSLQHDDLQVQNTQKSMVVSMLAWHGSQWTPHIQFTTPVTAQEFNDIFKDNNTRLANLRPRQRRSRPSLRFRCGGRNNSNGSHLHNVNLNLEMVAKVLGLPLTKEQERWFIAAARRAKKNSLCLTKLKTGYRRGEYCLRERCRVHRREDHVQCGS